MSENLKDVLDSIKEAINKNDDSIDSFLIATECWKELLDYITNLQQERDMYKGSFETMSKNYFEEKSRINKALKIIEQKRGEYDIPSELENLLRGE